MDAYRISDADRSLTDLIGRVEAGESVDIERNGQIVARLVPADPLRPRRIDVDALRRHAATLPFDPVDIVRDMREQARYQGGMIYCDTSLIVAALTAEIFSEKARDGLAAEDRPIAISPWTRVEVASALAMKQRRGAPTAASRANVEELWRDMQAAMLLLPIGENSFSPAMTLIDAQPRGLRSGDALHLAVAIHHGQSLATFDRDLADAARAIGIAVHPA